MKAVGESVAAGGSGKTQPVQAGQAKPVKGPSYKLLENTFICESWKRLEVPITGSKPENQRRSILGSHKVSRGKWACFNLETVNGGGGELRGGNGKRGGGGGTDLKPL